MGAKYLSSSLACAAVIKINFRFQRCDKIININNVDLANEASMQTPWPNQALEEKKMHKINRKPK